MKLNKSENMKKTSETRLDVLSAEFSNNIRIESSVEENTQVLVEGKEMRESDLSGEKRAVLNIKQYGIKQENITSPEQPPSDNHEEAATSLENTLDTNMEENTHMKPVVGKMQKGKEKNNQKK